MRAISTSACPSNGRPSARGIGGRLIGHGLRAQSAQNVVACELLACVDDVRTHGAGRERAIAHRLERTALSEIECHGNHVGPMRFQEPGHRRRGIESA